MHDQDSSRSAHVRTYEKRQYRHRQLYWRAVLPIAIILVTGYSLGYLLEALLLAALGVMVVMLVMLREIIDVLGYLGFVQREAADEREAIRQEISELKDQMHSPDNK